MPAPFGLLMPALHCAPSPPTNKASELGVASGAARRCCEVPASAQSHPVPDLTKQILNDGSNAVLKPATQRNQHCLALMWEAAHLLLLHLCNYSISQRGRFQASLAAANYICSTMMGCGDQPVSRRCVRVPGGFEAWNEVASL